MGAGGRAAGPAPPDRRSAEDIVDHAEAFKTLRVGDVMTPRADIVAVEISCPFEDLLARFLEAEHSRMPIYRETLDDPVGQVHVKDVFKMLVDESLRPAADEPVLRRLRREVLYVPGSMRAAALLLKMQASRIHMAMVIDEYGGADGLVTLEDLIEAVIGEIDDEHDEAASALGGRRSRGGVACSELARPRAAGGSGGRRGCGTLAPAGPGARISTPSPAWSAPWPAACRNGARVIQHPDGFEYRDHRR